MGQRKLADEKAGRWWRDHDVAEFFGISISTVRKWRLRGYGPEFRRIATSVRYEPAAIQRFAESLPSGITGYTEHQEVPSSRMRTKRMKEALIKK